MVSAGLVRRTLTFWLLVMRCRCIPRAPSALRLSGQVVYPYVPLARPTKAGVGRVVHEGTSRPIFKEKIETRERAAVDEHDHVTPAFYSLSGDGLILRFDTSYQHRTYEGTVLKTKVRHIHITFVSHIHNPRPDSLQRRRPRQSCHGLLERDPQKGGCSVVSLSKSFCSGHSTRRVILERNILVLALNAQGRTVIQPNTDPPQLKV